MEALDKNKDGKLALDEVMNVLQPTKEMDEESKAELRKQSVMISTRISFQNIVFFYGF